MSVQVLVGRFQEVRSDNRKCICSCCLYLLGETYSCSGRAASGSYVYRYSLVNDLNHTFGHLNLLILIDHMELTVTSKDEDTVYTMLDQVVDQFFSCLMLCSASRWNGVTIGVIMPSIFIIIIFLLL